MAQYTGGIPKFNINELIEKTSNYDADERFMATNDLCTILNKDIKLDDNTEKKICIAVLKQLGIELLKLL